MDLTISDNGNTINGILEENNSNHCVLLMHGFNAKKEGASTRFMAEHLGALGIDSYRFDLPGSGMDTTPKRDSTIEKTVSYLESCVSELSDKYDTFSLFGSSGSAPAAMIGAKVIGAKKVGLQAPATFGFLRQLKNYVSIHNITPIEGVYHFEYKGCPLDIAQHILDDESSQEPLLFNQVPYLVIHGSKDEIIPVLHAARLGTRFKDVNVVISKGAPHHCGQPDQPDYAASILAPWFAK